MRGEYYISIAVRSAVLGSPPHARGIRFLPAAHSRKRGITPACAGNTSFLRNANNVIWDHPRMRGEYSFAHS